MNLEIISEYPLFKVSGNFKILKKWEAILPGARTWRLAETLEDKVLFACSGLGTMQRNYCLEEAVRLKGIPEEVQEGLLLHLNVETAKELGPVIDICSIVRTMRDSDLPF